MRRSGGNWSSASRHRRRGRAPPHCGGTPYGDVTARDVAIAAHLGLRLVMPWSVNGTISDNGDWQLGITAARILRNETKGWGNGVVIHGGQSSRATTAAQS